MAVTNAGGIITLTAVSDVFTYPVQVRTMLVQHTTATATVLKDGDGTVIFTIPAGQATGLIVIPFGGTGKTFDNGIELDAAGANPYLALFLA